MRARSAATKVLRTAQTEVNRAVTADRQARGQFDRERDDHQAALRETADPAIGEFIAEHQVLLNLERRNWEALRREEQRHVGYRMGVSQYETWNTNEGLRERAESIQAAIEAAEALKLQDATDVAKQLDKLRATIPALDDLELRKVA